MVFLTEYQTELLSFEIQTLNSDLFEEIRKNKVVQKWDENTLILSNRILKPTDL